MRRTTLYVTVLVALAACTTATETGDTTTSTLAPVTTTSTQPPTTTTVPAPSTTTADSAPAPPAGMREFGGAEVGFTMWVPQDWVTIGSDEFDPEAVSEALGDSFDPQIVESIRAVFEAGGALFAIDPVPVEGFASNVNVIGGASSGLTPDGLAGLLPAQLEQGLGATDVVVDVVEVSAGEAVRVSYALPAIGSEGLIYQIFTEDVEWVVTFSALDIEGLGFEVEDLVDSFTPVGG